METIHLSGLGSLPEAAGKILTLIGRRGTVALYGGMGAGKTTLVRELCRQLGVEENVNSPTFSIVNEYRAADGSSIYHFDLYRIEQPGEIFDFGYEEYFDDDHLCLIEWPEKAEFMLPDHHTRLWVDVLEDGSRQIRIETI